MLTVQELILFSRADLERSIPSMVDGLKPGQRKILFCCLKRNIRKDVKARPLHPCPSGVDFGMLRQNSPFPVWHPEARVSCACVNSSMTLAGGAAVRLCVGGHSLPPRGDQPAEHHHRPCAQLHRQQQRERAGACWWDS